LTATTPTNVLPWLSYDDVGARVELLQCFSRFFVVIFNGRILCLLTFRPGFSFFAIKVGRSSLTHFSVSPRFFLSFLEVCVLAHENFVEFLKRSLFER
jgi:hypothetical protein